MSRQGIPAEDYGTIGQSVADLYGSGLSTNAIARQLGMSRSKVQRILTRRNIPRRVFANQYTGNPYRADESQAAAALYATGLSTHAIAARTNTSQERVARMLKSIGVTLRSKNSQCRKVVRTINIDGSVRAIMKETEIAALYQGRAYE